MLKWSARTRLAAAAAAAAAGILAATLGVVRPTWLFPIPSREPPIPLPEPYASYQIFDGDLIDTQPTADRLDEILGDFSKHIKNKASNVGFSDEQCIDLAAAAAERMRSILDPDFERDYAQAVTRGLKTPADVLAPQFRKSAFKLERLRLAAFGLKSAIVTPMNGPQTYERLWGRRSIGYSSQSLRIQPEYDRSGIGPSSPKAEILFPLRVPVFDRKTNQYTDSPSAVVVFSFEFAWAETDTRRKWVPEKYIQYTCSGVFPFTTAEEFEKFIVSAYPMAF